MRKNDTVFYVAHHGTGTIVRAKVIIAHKDGGATIQPWFFHEEGRDSGPYIGGRYKLPADCIHTSAMEAEIYRAVARSLAAEKPVREEA